MENGGGGGVGFNRGVIVIDDSRGLCFHVSNRRLRAFLVLSWERSRGFVCMTDITLRAGILEHIGVVLDWNWNWIG